jgi:hypothetical protein
MALSIMELNVEYCYAECRKQAHYDECHYAECRYAECRGAGPLGSLVIGE